ncbi:hypothetical protein [Streptomyces cinerochromogenes]|uniref:hypothetical protein n=1 Tax=Streptomyces cinerochromogenes TaxID=66422 RepID=UPI00166FF018|nr:hypothetical protein [Streptomyces cinerochromogenes]GGS44378.1 hypothetical protein GCM10010206_02130 [Streptomyces cinerochromogenes]
MPYDQHSDPHSDSFEDRLSAALHQAGGAFEADRGALAAAGALRGRRLRLRRRAAVVGGVTGVALAGACGALLVPWGHGSPAAPQPSSLAAGPRPAGTHAPGVGKEQMIRTLERLLPPGKSGEETGRGSEEGPAVFPFASVVYDDGHGAAAVSVSVNRVEPGGTDARQAVECPDKVYVPYDSCVTKRLTDGSVIRVMRGYEYPDRRAQTKLWTAELVTPAGQHVAVSEWNAPSEKGVAVSRDEPPLDPAALTRLASAEEWRTLVDALPHDPRRPEADPTDPGAGLHARSRLLSLLPRRLKIVGRSGDDGDFAYVVVDDGKGRSLVQVNVQPDQNEVRDDLFGPDDETLADGTRVAVHQGPGEKGGDGVVMWTVDTMRKDGFRVVISAFNSGTQHDSATRATPALTVAQLRGIALDPRWRS